MLPVIADDLKLLGHEVVTFNDDESTTQSENLDAIVDWTNAQDAQLAVSIHFNAYVPTSGPRGTEVLFVTQDQLADMVVDAIAEASGLINRGPKERHDLAFLNGTEVPAILIETAFVDSATDAKLYNQHFSAICSAIASAIDDWQREEEDEPNEEA